MVQSFYIAFENSDEWEHSADWGVFCSRYRFPDATIKENKVNVVGSNGVIDLSSELTGDVVFNNVQGEIGFIILRDSNFDYLAFKNKYHGKRVKIMPDNDIEHYRIGRLSIKEDNNQDVLKSVSMVLDADPFRYAAQETKYIVPINTNALQTPSEATSLNKYGDAIKSGNVFQIRNTSSFDDFILGTGSRPTGYRYRIKIRFPFATNANKKYCVMLNFKTYRDARSAFDAYDEKKSTPFVEYYEGYDFKISNSTGGTLFTYTQLPKKANEQKNLVFFFEATDNISRLDFSGTVTQLFSRIDTIKTHFEISNIQIIEITNDITLKNDGRKALVPRLISTKDCELIINEQFSALSQNREKKNFDLVVENGIENNFVAYGEETGTVTIRYREAYL